MSDDDADAEINMAGNPAALVAVHYHFGGVR